MTKTFAAALLLSALALPAYAATPADILAANKTAMGGEAWSSKATLTLDYAFSGQGLTGTADTQMDLSRGAFIDRYDLPPTEGASGYDGEKAWEREPSGTVTDQAGGDVIPLAVSESYLDRNLWWQKDFGGAAVADKGTKTEKGQSYDALAVTPKGGAPVEAWFDAKTHLLARTIERNGTTMVTTDFSDYAPVDGAMIAHKLVIDDGSHNLQTMTVTNARFSPALPASAYAKPEEHLTDFSIAGGQHETSVPFRLVNNHIYADVSVNGSKPMTFIFDTGGHSILTPETAKARGITPKGNMTSSGGGDQLATSGLASVKSIRVGDATIRDQAVTVMSFSPKGVEGVGEQGMVGYEFFARFITRFDYGHHTVTFIDKKYFDPKDAGTPVPMRLYHQLPEILGTYDGIPGRFGVDTGSRMPLMLTGPYAAAHDLRAKAPKGVEAVTGWGVGGPSRSFVFHGGTLTLGDVTIGHPLTMISLDKGGTGGSPVFPNNVGGGVLKRFVVTFDYDHSTMYLKPVAGDVADLDSYDRAGMWINNSAKGFEVVNVTKGSPAEKAGLMKGDVITAVDGKPANTVKLYELRQRLRDDAPGTKVDFTLASGKTVTVTLKDLI